VAAEHFEAIAAGVLSRKRVNIVYLSRARDERTERDISPQRMVHYRDNWYVDAWCHLRVGLRSFSLDAIQAATLLEEPAMDVPAEDLDRELGEGYGIFSGARTRTAVLRFSEVAARWVSTEKWHSHQNGRFEPDGTYVLEFPYTGDRELIMDILRHGQDVEVITPQELRAAVRAQAEAILKKNS
jgi:predicted DNA-binding transcriptional regulator YafY